MILITIVTGVYKLIYNWGPHIVTIQKMLTGRWKSSPQQKIIDVEWYGMGSRFRCNQIDASYKTGPVQEILWNTQILDHLITYNCEFMVNLGTKSGFSHGFSLPPGKSCSSTSCFHGQLTFWSPVTVGGVVGSTGHHGLRHEVPYETSLARSRFRVSSCEIFSVEVILE